MSLLLFIIGLALVIIEPFFQNQDTLGIVFMSIAVAIWAVSLVLFALVASSGSR